MIHFLTKYATWKNILLLFGLNLIFNLVIFPLANISSSGVLPLDLHFSYSPDEAYQVLAQFSTDELRRYMMTELTVDVFYPVAYALLLSFLLFKLSQKVAISMVPIAVLVFDYLENLGIVTMIQYYPQKLSNVATITSLFTSLKWSLVVLSVILIILFLVKKLFAGSVTK